MNLYPVQIITEFNIPRKMVCGNFHTIIFTIWQEMNLVFPSRAGNYHYQSNVLQELKRVAKAAGITKRVNLHMLRHICAAIHIAQKKNIYVLSRRLGHENISITLDYYGHLQSGSQTEAATAYQEFMKE